MEVQLLRRRSNTGSEEPLAYLKITQKKVDMSVNQLEGELKGGS